MKPIVFLMLGYPGSGKTTLSKLISAETGAVRINSDELRRSMFTTVKEIQDTKLNPYVFGALDYAMEATLSSGYSVVYDANNNRLINRDKCRAIAGQHGAETVVVWVRTPLETARQREAGRRLEDGYLSIPDKRYDQIAKALQAPLEREMTVRIDGLTPPEEQLASFRQQMAGLVSG